MAKLSKQDVMFKRHLTWTCIIATVIVPIISYIILPTIRLFTASNTVYSLLGYFLNALNTVDLFLVYGVLISSLVRLGLNNSKPIITFSFIRYAIIYASNVLIAVVLAPYVISNYEVNLVYALLSFGINIIVDVLPFIGAILMTLFLCSKFLDERNTDVTIRKVFDKKNPILVITLWVNILISATLLSAVLVGTATDLSNYLSYGYQVTNRVIAILAEPYIEWLIKTVAGYFIMLGVGKWFEFQWAQSHEI